MTAPLQRVLDPLGEQAVRSLGKQGFHILCFGLRLALC